MFHIGTLCLDFGIAESNQYESNLIVQIFI